MKFKIQIQGKEYEVDITPLKDSKTRIRIGKEDYYFSPKESKEKRTIARTSLPKRNFKEKEINAPIAGIISNVFVKKGDIIKEGKKVFLLSAMKMENEIVSDYQGKIKKILVKKEQKVKEGEVLLIMD